MFQSTSNQVDGSWKYNNVVLNLVVIGIDDVKKLCLTLISLFYMCFRWDMFLSACIQGDFEQMTDADIVWLPVTWLSRV